MRFVLKTTIEIVATPEKIWSILTDFKDYPNWNPFVTSLTGDFKVGHKIKIRIQPPNAKANTFHATVIDCEPYKKLSWIGVFLIRGVFDGKHQFQLIDNGDGSTTLVQMEHFTGILVFFFKKMLNNNTRCGFDAMNKKIKELAENRLD